MKFEHSIIDVFDDVNLPQTMKKIASTIPSDLRKVSLPTIEDRDALDDSQFALCIFTKSASKLNKFPVNDRINTALSNEYFDLHHDKLPAEAQKIAATYIKLACEKFKIEPRETVKLASAQFPTMTNIFFENDKSVAGGSLKKLASQEKGKDSPYYYALTKTAGDGLANRAYAMPDADSVKKAEAYFDKYASHFSPEDRHQYAYNVVRRAVELGTQINSDLVNKYAGLSYNPGLDGHISSRKKLVEGNLQFEEALSKLASYQKTTDPSTFAKVLHGFDKRAGLDKYYDKYLSDPFAATFGHVKTASVIYTIDGIDIKEGDIQKLASERYDTLKTYFGSTLAEGLKKEGSAAFLALPDDAKEIIARISNGEIK